MQFFVPKRPISEKVIHSLTSQPRPNCTTCSRGHTNLYHLLPIGGELVPRSSGTSYTVLADVVIDRKNNRSANFLHALYAPCRSNHSKLPHAERDTTSFSNAARVTWIGVARQEATASPRGKSTLHLHQDLKPSSLRGRAQKFRRKDEQTTKGGYKPTRCSKPHGDENHPTGDDRNTSYDADPGYYKPTPCSKTRSDKNDHKHDKLSSKYDAILVLAGGQIAGGGVPAWVEKRLDKALELQRISNSKNRISGQNACKIVCLGGGTPHRAPILSSENFVVHESSSCAAYLHSRGVPFRDVIKEWASYDTIGNGFFSLTQHAIPRRWRTLAVVTSAFHMPRTTAIFEWIFGLEGAAIAIQEVETDEEDGFRLEFHSVSDDDVMDQSVIQARLDRERHSIENLNILVQSIHSLENFHEWFHTEHKAYNTEDQQLFGKEEKSDPALLSY